MSITFRERSRVERSVLDLVNTSGHGAVQLCGLSRLALDAWYAQIKNTQALNTSPEKIKRLLTEISIRISSDSDASKHVFAGEVFLENGTLEYSIAELKRSLQA